MKRYILLPALLLLANASLEAAQSGQEYTIEQLMGDIPRNSQQAIAILKANKKLAGKMSRGYTPATKAAYWGNTAVLKCIHRLNAGLLTQIDGNKHTAATTAVLVGNTTVLKCLRDLDPNLLTQIDGNKLTPATKAALNGKTAILECLHSLDVDLNQEDGNGFTVRGIAERSKNQEILNLLTRLENGEGSNGDSEEAPALTPASGSGGPTVTPAVRTPEKPETPSGGSALYVVMFCLLVCVLLVAGLSLQVEDETPEPQTEPQLQEDERSPIPLEEAVA